LRNEGTEFNILLRQTREQLAKKYLLENYSIEDITYLLGFSEPSAFRRAFKKWFGVTTKEYREIERNKLSNT
jgi:AraC-like DNA-binding protein